MSKFKDNSGHFRDLYELRGERVNSTCKKTGYTCKIFCHVNKGEKFCNFQFAILLTDPLQKRESALKGKNLLPFQKGGNSNCDRVAFPESVSIHYKSLIQ